MSTNLNISDEALKTHQKLQNNLPYFAKTQLQIRSKKGKMEPLVFNRAQQYIHYRLEKQLKETGRVRAIILKGRQQGCSTYIAARYYHKATRRGGKAVFILSHHAGTTEALYLMVDRFHSNCPEEVKPTATTANQRRMRFDNESSYVVGTAGSKNVGRGETIQFFHGSEVAFYEDTDSLETGVLQAIAEEPDSESILESTANGVGGFFYAKTMQAVKGEGDYQIIFIPWYWQEEYRKEVPPGTEFTQEERKIQQMYGLDDQQLYWRKAKIIEFRDEWKFKQEYPFTIQEAFQVSSDALISPALVQQARKAKIANSKTAPLILGVDAARQGDRTVLTFRRGRVIEDIKVYQTMDEMQLVGIIADAIDRRGVTKVFCDRASAYGAIDRLKELGYGHYVMGVNFNQTPERPECYNKRAEMYMNMKDWFEDGLVSIPDREDVELDLLSVPKTTLTSNSQHKLIPKEDIKKELGYSPDIADSMALTFAYKVAPNAMHGGVRVITPSNPKYRQRALATRRAMNQMHKPRF